MNPDHPLNPDSTASALVLAHCTYTARGVRECHVRELPRLPPVLPYLATGTVVQQGQTLAGLILCCDLPLTDPYLPALVDRMVGTVPSLQELLEDDPGRVLIVEPVDHRRGLPRVPDATLCREIFLHCFLRHAAAGAA